MSLGSLKVLYLVVCLILGIAILSPTLTGYVILPHGEAFSELWILGPNRLAEDYPFNVTANRVYRVYLGVADHMGDLEDYRVYVKLRNLTDSIPDVVNGTPSSLSPLGEYRVFLDENGIWEEIVDFSFEGISFDGNFSRISKLVLGNYVFYVDKTIVWDDENQGFYCQLIFELWRYNMTFSGFQFHNRFVGVWLNVTQSS